MTKSQIVPLTKEEMDKLMLEIEKKNEFDFMLFTVLKTTGRRIGELYGIEETKVISRKITGKRTISIDGVPTEIDKTIPVYKKTGQWILGVKVKDINLDDATMKVWVLKRRQYIQDETVLTPEAVRVLQRHIYKNKLNLEDFVFRAKNRSLRQIQNVIKTYAKKAVIEHPVCIHNFRHYFITELKRQGWDNDKIRKLTGHKSAQVLGIYDHIVAEDLRDEALEAIKVI